MNSGLTYSMKKNISFSHHWTEESSQVLDFLESVFGQKPNRVSVSYQGDISIAGKIIEIKSCLERIRHNNGCGVTTRRGQFHFGGHEHNADYILFVLVHLDGRLSFALHDTKDFPRIAECKVFKINYLRVFGEPPTKGGE